IELVVGVASDRRREDEPERVERSQADDEEEGVPPQQSDQARAPSWSHVGSTRRRENCDRSIEPLGSIDLHVVTIRLRAQSDNPISTLAMPRSITATLAAVPFDPLEKLRQM